MKQLQLKTALSIAGSDSGGGAGIQADIKTFHSLGVHGVTAVTCLTAQNPRGVSMVQPATARIVKAQLESVFTELRPAAAKTGMLYSKPIIQEVAQFWRQKNMPPLVVDPVMIATSGSRLLKPDAVRCIKDSLLPLAKLITPNLDEAAELLGWKVDDPSQLKEAAEQLSWQYGCAILIKGGHFTQTKDAIDLLYDPETGDEWLLSAPYIRGMSTHGTGCTYSAAITAGLAQGMDLFAAVNQAKEFISRAIGTSRRIGKHQVLNFAAPGKAKG